MKISLSSLRIQTLLLTSVLVVTISLSLGAYLASQQRQQLLGQYSNSFRQAGSQMEQEIQSSLEMARRQALFLAGTPPIQGIIRATESGYDQLGQSTSAVWKARLTTIFKSIASTNPDYFQIRFIGAADDGRELVRVDVQNGEIIAPPPALLQKKAHRDYFKSTRQLAAGEVYTSNINLNRERGIVEIPHRPTTRVSTPIYTNEGEFFGLIVINVDMNALFNEIAQILDEYTENGYGTEVYLADGSGHYFLHPDMDQRFAFEFGPATDWKTDFPELTEPLKADTGGASALRSGELSTPLISSNGPSGPRYVSARTITFDDNRQPLKLILTVSENSLDQNITPMVSRVIATSLFLGAVVLMVFLWLLSRQLAPLATLANAARRIANGEEGVELPSSHTDELNNLIDAFEFLITRVREREKHLQESNEYANQIIQIAPQGMVIVDEDWSIAKVNRNAMEIFHYQAGEMIGMPLEQLLPESLRARHIRRREEFIAAPAQRTIGEDLDLQAITKEGDLFPIEVGLAPMTHNGKLQVVVSIVDISARKTMENALAENREELKRNIRELEQARDEANRLVQMKSEFLANMSHEIRTPMTAILGLIDILRTTDLTRRQQQYLFQVHNSSRALLHIINDILDISKIDAGKISLENNNFSLLETVESCVDLFAPSADLKSISLHLKLDPSLTTQVVGDRTRLSQVLNNLLGNAIKFTDQGQIVLSTSAISRGEKQIKLRFSVADTGIGIDQQVIARLFEPFEQADSATTRVYGGSGLGLTISRKLVSLMGGELRVHSEPGKGSTFWFDLEFALSNQPDDLLSKIGNLKKRVLVVDDQPINCEILAEMLTHWGCRVSAAYNGKQALEKLVVGAEAGDPYDLVVADWLMPEMDGYALARKIHRLYEMHKLSYEPPVLMITEAERSELASSSHFDETIEVLTKPITISRLLNSLAAQGHISLVQSDSPDGQRIGLEQELKRKLLAQAKKMRILLVEDNITNQLVIKELLAHYSLKISIANNGREAVELVGEREFDLVLMDLQMPVMDGFEATQRIRETHDESRLPILALSAATFTEDVQQAARAGMNDHLTKPIDMERLLTALLKWLPLSELEDVNTPTAQPTTPPATQSGSTEFEPVDALVRKPGFDLSATLLTSAGPDAYLRVVRAFRDEYDEIIKRWENGDETSMQAIRLAHSLKSAAGNIGAVTLQNLARESEVLLRAGSDEKVTKDLFAELRKTLATVDYALSLQPSTAG